MAAASVPTKQLSFLASRFSGVSKNSIRMESSSARNGVRSGSVITVSLPSASLAELSSLTLHADGIATNAHFPEPMNLIQRVEVICNGVSVSGNSTYYNICDSMKQALTGERRDNVTHRAVVHSANTQQVGRPSQINPGQEIKANSETCKINIGGWKYGMLNPSPQIIDLELLSSIQVKFTLAPDAVLVSTNGTPSYQLDNVFFSMSSYVINNPAYDSMISAQMSQMQYLPVTFKEVTCTKTLHSSGLSRVNISSRSIDRLFVGFKHRDLDSAGAPELLDSLKPGGTQNAPYDLVSRTGTFGNSIVAQNTAPFSAGAQAWFSLGGSRYPQYNANLDREWLTLREQGKYDDECKDVPIKVNMSGSDVYLAQHVLVAKLDLPGNFDGHQMASGSDSRGSAITASIETTGISADTSCYFVSETSSLLQIGAGKLIQILR